MNRLFSLLISFLMLFSFSTAYAQPIIVGEDSAPTYPENLVDGGDPAVAIEEARNANPEEFAWKVDQLRQSKALMALFKGAPDEETVKFYLEFFAMQSSVEQVKTFVANTEGKHFEVSGTADRPIIQLKDGTPSDKNISTKSHCYRRHRRGRCRDLRSDHVAHRIPSKLRQRMQLKCNALIMNRTH